MKEIEQKIAWILNEIEYGQEFPKEAIQLAKENGIIILSGYSDDVVSVNGMFTDEAYPDEDDYVYFNVKGVVEHNQDYFDTLQEQIDFLKEYGVHIDKNKIKATFGEGEYDWEFKTEIPHETFVILDEGEKYCKGIVFSITNLF